MIPDYPKDDKKIIETNEREDHQFQYFVYGLWVVGLVIFGAVGFYFMLMLLAGRGR